MSSSRGAVPATLERRDAGWTSTRVQSNSRSIQGQFKVPTGWVQGGYSGTSPGDRYGSQARTRQARRLGAGVEVRAPTRLRWLQGPAIIGRRAANLSADSRIQAGRNPVNPRSETGSHGAHQRLRE